MDRTTSFISVVTAVLMAGATLFAGAGTVEAQEPEFSFGVFGGGFATTELNATSQEDFFTEDNPAAEIHLETTGQLGAQAEVWVSDRFGVRANGAYADATLGLDEPDDAPTAGMADDANIADMDVWLGDVSGMLRLLPEEAAVTPFISAGAGFVHYDPAGDGAVVVDAANAQIPNDEAEAGTENDETQLAGSIGLGADVSPEGWPVTIRGEITDRISGSPAMIVLNDEDILPGGADVEGDTDFGIVHNLGFTLGLQWFPGQS